MSSTKPPQPICLYHAPLSGHCHRVHTFLSMLPLPLPHELIDVDLKRLEQKEWSYLSKNSIGQVPMIEDGAQVLSDSTAILVYLVKQYGNAHWLPDDPVGAAQVQRYLSMASGEIAHGLHAARRVKVFDAPLGHGAVVQTAQRIFSVLNMALERSAFLVGTTPTIADPAVYRYVARSRGRGFTRPFRQNQCLAHARRSASKLRSHASRTLGAPHLTPRIIMKPSTFTAHPTFVPLVSSGRKGADAASAPSLYSDIANSPLFLSASRRQQRLVFVLMLISLAYYIALILGAAYFRELFALRLWGRINLGTLFAVSQFPFAGLIACVYTLCMRPIDAAMCQFDSRA